MKPIVVVQARTNSTRFPRKVFADLGGSPMVAQIARRCAATRIPVVVSCPTDEAKEFSEYVTVPIVPGPEQDIVMRLLLAAAYAKATHVVRVTGDCPLIPHDLIVAGLEMSSKGAPCVQNWRPRTFPDGFDFEIWDVAFLVSLKSKLKLEDCEYFAQWCLDRKLPSVPLTYAGENMSHIRLTVDYPEDLEVVREIYADQGDEIWESGRVVEWCKDHPQTMAINAGKADGKFGAKA